LDNKGRDERGAEMLAELLPGGIAGAEALKKE